MLYLSQIILELHAWFIKMCCQLIVVYVFVLFQDTSPFQLIIPHPDLNKKDRKSYFVALDSIIKSANVKVFRKILTLLVEIVLNYKKTVFTKNVVENKHQPA